MRNKIRGIKDGLNRKFLNKSQNNPIVFLDSQGELSIFKCNGVIAYSDTCVKIRTEDSFVSVEGEGLLLNTFSNREITVSGKINKIELGGGC